MKTSEEILADTLLKYEADITKEEILEAIREPKPEYQEEWVKPSLEAMESYAQQRFNEVKENYKECFEKFIPVEKWDEATEFLSTDNGNLPNDFLTRNQS